MALPKLGRANIFYFLIFSLFHLLQTALCLSITRLHCSLISFLWPFASLFLCSWPQESRTGLLISWPAVLLVHTCSFSLPGRRTGLYFCFSAADRRQDAAAHGRAAELWCSECVSGYCWSAPPKAALPPALFSVSRDSSPPCLTDCRKGVVTNICSALYIQCTLIHSFPTVIHEISVIPLLEMGKLRLKENKMFAQG